MTSAASRLLREVRDISSQQIPVVFGEPEEADILHSCRLHAALTGVRRAAGAPSRCAEVTRARGHTRGILDDIFDRSILYLRIVCTQTTRKRAHS